VKPLKVTHVITRLVVGGAQENTILSCSLIDRERFPSDIVCGPQTGSEGDLFAECAARGVPVHIEPSMVREVSPLKDALCVARLIALFRRTRPDIVHTHTSKAGILGRAAARGAGVPVVIQTAHGWGFHKEQPVLERALYVNLERATAPLADAMIVVAEPNRALAHELRIGRPGQYHLIRSGIELEAYRRDEAEGRAIRAEFDLPDGAFVFGSVGRLSAQKAPQDAMEAFVRVAALHPEAHFVLVGNGPLMDDVRARARAGGVEGRVRFAGLRRDVGAFLSAFDAFVLSSRYEGLPRVVPQAMAAGLPVVATAVDGTPEAVVEDVSGWLVPPGDVAALADRMARLAADPARARAMGQEGLRRVDEFSARRMVDQLADLYVRLAAGAAERGRGR
jgi:glycosyltransferase involved in cell wall biosynthesis